MTAAVTGRCKHGKFLSSSADIGFSWRTLTNINPSHALSSYFFKVHFNIIAHLRVNLQVFSLHQVSQQKPICIFILPIHSTNPAYLHKQHTAFFEMLQQLLRQLYGTCVEWVAVPLQSGQTAATLSEIKNAVNWFAFQMISHTVTSPISKSVSQPVALIQCHVQETLTSY